MARLALVWAVLALALSGQPSTVPVTLAWDLDATHEGATWEVEADGQNVTCGSVAVTAMDRRCTSQLPVGSYAIRLRGTVQGDDGPLVGGWSEPITANLTAPGPYTITAHWESETPEPMALALSNLTSGFSTSNPATTASVSPTSGAILYVVIGYSVVGGGAYSPSDVVAPSGVMSTWTVVGSIGTISDRRGLRVYRGTGTITPGTISITATLQGGTFESAQWSVNQVTGHDTTTPNDTAAVAVYSSAGTSAATGSVGTLDSGDITFAAFTHETNEDVTLESGYTQLSHTANATGLRTLTVGYHTSDTTPTASWASASGWNAAGLIINAGEVEPDPLEITTTTLPNGTVGTPYSQNLAATGGTPPYTWSVISGALPDGLSLSGNTISGTPTVADTFNFTVEVEDDEAETDTQELSIIIEEAPTVPMLHGSVSTGTQLNGGLALTIAHTIGAGSNLALYVFVGIDRNGDDSTVTATWNGTSMTKIGEVIGSSVNQHAAMFRLLNPEVGTFNVVINSANENTAFHKTGTVMAFTNVHQSTPEGTVVVGGGVASSASRNVTSSATGLVLDGICVNDNPTLTVGANQMQRSNFNAGDSAGTMHATSTEPGDSTVTMSWTWTGDQRTAQIIVPINSPAAAFQPAWARGANQVLQPGVH